MVWRWGRPRRAFPFRFRDFMLQSYVWVSSMESDSTPKNRFWQNRLMRFGSFHGERKLILVGIFSHFFYYPSILSPSIINNEVFLCCCCCIPCVVVAALNNSKVLSKLEKEERLGSKPISLRFNTSIVKKWLCPFKIYMFFFYLLYYYYLLSISNNLNVFA